MSETPPVLGPSQYQQEKRKIKKLKEINDASRTKSKESPSMVSYHSLWSAASVGGIKSG